MRLQHTTPMEAFFACFVFCFSFAMMVAANPTYDYGFLWRYEIYLFVMTMYLSPIQYWIVWNYPRHVMRAAEKVGTNGVMLTHYIVLVIKVLEGFAYTNVVQGGRFWDLIYYNRYEHRFFDEMALFSVFAGQLLVWAVYFRIGVDGVNYGAQMERPIPWVFGFPFNTGTRHPQYIGCVLAWISLFTLMTPTDQLGKLVVASWAVLTSYWLSGEVEVEEPPPSPGAPRVIKGVKKRT